MKRFYKETAVDAGDGGFRVLLDGRPMRTPAKAVLVVPTEPMAGAIAKEWRDVPEKAEINASHLPLTRFAATGLDRVTAQRERVIEDTRSTRRPTCCAIAPPIRRAWCSASTSSGSRCSIGWPSATMHGW
jgi:hypothetical protein